MELPLIGVQASDAVPLTVARLIRRIAGKAWAPPLALIAVVFLTSWPLMIAAEPAGAQLTEPENYWWFFLVTSATVGYGDFYPVTTAGHLVGAYIIAGGIATLTTLFARLAVVIDNAKGRRMNGSADVKAADHLVVVGYTPGRTERLVDEILADIDGRRLVLCAAPDTLSHPMPDRDVDFVRGDLTDEAVLRRAAVDQASRLLIDANDDNEALAILVTVNHLVDACHVVVALRDMERAQHLSYVDTNVRCVHWHHPRMLTEELHDPGIARVYTDLMTSGGDNTYSVALPSGLNQITFGQCQTMLGQRHSAILLAVDTGGELAISPSWDTPIAAGSVLYYIGKQRLRPEQLSV
ncbi:MAG TPA: ion channel [Candidatus Limnocylindrales bacterium]|nr:ion channel [Candidatus Limnocylindrales bacterium]